MQQDGSPVATRPVFVDATGRRGRWVHRLFVALGLLVAAYIAVVFLALVGPPSLSRLAIPGLGPVLPGSGAPGLRTATGGHGKPASVLSPRPSPSARPVASSTAGPAGTTSRPSPGPAGLPAPSSLPTRGPSPTPTSPATAPTTGPPASPRPRSSQTPPGQTSSRPSPRSSHARGGTAQPSPTP